MTVAVRGQDRDSKALPYIWVDVVRCHDSDSLDSLNLYTTKVILYRLLILDDPAQDKNSVEETADLLFIVDQVVDNMEQAAERLDNNSSPEGEVFSRTAKEFQSIRLEWEAKLVAVFSIPDPHLTMESANGRLDNAAGALLRNMIPVCSLSCGGSTCVRIPKFGQPKEKENIMAR